MLSISIQSSGLLLIINPKPLLIQWFFFYFSSNWLKFLDASDLMFVLLFILLERSKLLSLLSLLPNTGTSLDVWHRFHSLSMSPLRMGYFLYVETFHASPYFCRAESIVFQSRPSPKLCCLYSWCFRDFSPFLFVHLTLIMRMRIMIVPIQQVCLRNFFSPLSSTRILKLGLVVSS
jgi:hypothetical protein